MAEAELEAMDLPHALQACEADERIPPSLVEQIVVVQQLGGEGAVVRSLQALAQRAKDMQAPYLSTCDSMCNSRCDSRRDSRRDRTPVTGMRTCGIVQALCMSVDVQLEVEEGADLQLQQTHGARWRCLRSSQLTADSREELSELRAQLSEATAADGALEAAYNARRPHLEPFEFPLDVLHEQVPRAGTKLTELQCTQDCASLVESLSTLSKAREALLTEARAKANADDITQAFACSAEASGCPICSCHTRCRVLLSTLHHRIRCHICRYA